MPADRPRPLDGVRVVELGGVGPVPFAGMMLAELGADVVRFDRSGAAPNALHRGKRSMTMDLKSPTDSELAHRLIATSSIVIEGFRPGAMERAGFGPADVWRRAPHVVYGRSTGWGSGGPLSQTAGHDINFLALTGALHAIGTARSGPVVPLNLIGDFGAGGAYLVIGVLAALRTAERTGVGELVDAAILDGVLHLMSSLWGRVSRGEWLDERAQNELDGGAPYYGVYETADGRHMAVGAIEPKFFRVLLDLLDLPDEPAAAQRDRSRWPELRDAIAERFRRRTQEQWDAVFSGTDACVSPVRSLSEAAGDPHVAARGSLVFDGSSMRPAPAPRLSSAAAGHTHIPTPGEHTAEVVGDWLEPSSTEQPAR